jgi:hypothetical protein
MTDAEHHPELSNPIVCQTCGIVIQPEDIPDRIRLCQGCERTVCTTCYVKRDDELYCPDCADELFLW